MMFFLHKFFTRTHTHTRFNTDVFQRARSFTEVVVHRKTFTQRCFDTEMASHTHTQALFHTHTRAHTHTAHAPTHFYTEMILH